MNEERLFRFALIVAAVMLIAGCVSMTAVMLAVDSSIAVMLPLGGLMLGVLVLTHEVRRRSSR